MTRSGGTTSSATGSIGLRRRLVRAPGAPLAAVVLLLSIGFAALSIHAGAHLRQVPADATPPARPS